MSRELYVRNLPVEIDEDGVRRIFAVAGKVSFVHLVKDARSGEYRGTVFVKMASEAQAKEAIELLDGARIEARPISVEIARPQTPPGGAKSPRGGKSGGRRPGTASGHKR